MLSVLLSVALFATSAFGGSICPPRENIYPCSCANIHQTKKIIHTVVNCHRLQDSDVLSGIFPTLRTMQIDQFHLYDSFWEAQKLGLVGETKRVLPSDWFTLLKIKELEIVDSALSSCFACQGKLSCRNSVTNRFTAVNVSSSEKFCALCDNGKGSKYSWTSCMSRLKHFHFSYGKLTTLGSDMFPLDMRELTLLNLTHNQIAKIDPNALKNLKRLVSLDLSHNAIEYIELFNQPMNLEYLDLSWNNIKAIGTIFNYLPLLNTFKVQSNNIIDLKELEWKKAPDSLKYIDLSDNPLHCDCNIRWINSTFHVNVILLGTCTSPDDYENSALRRASRFLNERCDDDGNIGTRLRITTTPVPKL